ncbi:MAG: hypothetical protein RLY71_686 [Pseudomonadota bacterium]|jgi:pathogenesis-related protein 1
MRPGWLLPALAITLAGVGQPASQAAAQPGVPSIVIILEGYPGDDEPSPPDPLAAPDFDSAVGLSPLQQQALLQRHNDWRSWFSVPALQWSDELAGSAARWAFQLDRDGECQLGHSHQPGVGENIYRVTPRTSPSGRTRVLELYPDQVVDAWGSELDDYAVETRACAPGKVCGHFTQMVWQASTTIGCARRICASKNQVWVCQYWPAGNIIGERPF